RRLARRFDRRRNHARSSPALLSLEAAKRLARPPGRDDPLLRSIAHRGSRVVPARSRRIGGSAQYREIGAITWKLRPKSIALKPTAWGRCKSPQTSYGAPKRNARF